MKVVLIVLGVLAGLALLLVGGCAALIYFGLGQAEEAVKAELQKNPTFVEKVGTVEELSLDWGNEQGGFTFVGTKASGTVTVKNQGNDNLWTVKLDSGESFDVVLSETGINVETNVDAPAGDNMEDTPTEAGADAPSEAGDAMNDNTASQPAGG